jgi:hypothetical protein
MKAALIRLGIRGFNPKLKLIFNSAICEVIDRQ